MDDGVTNVEALSIPDKLYFKIGEVAKIIGVEPYVLRYWETEFPEIAPVKSKTRQRLYKRQDVELISQIRDLLYKEKFTIKGAKKHIQEQKGYKKQGSPLPSAVSVNAQSSLDLDASAEKLLGVSKVLEEVIEDMDAFLND